MHETPCSQRVRACPQSVDCPHRERLGYIGDAHTTLETALQNFASVPFYTKWAQDITDIQGYPAHSGCGYGECKLPVGLGDPVGYIAHTAPTIDGGGGPGWSGFVCVMPCPTRLRQTTISPSRPDFQKCSSKVDRSFEAHNRGLGPS